MSESKELVLVSLPAAPADLEAAFIDDEYISNLIKEIREKASSVVGDVNTAKGRGVYITMSANVRKAKTAIDEAGKALVADMKKRPALVDASRRKVREALDQLAIDIRKPATEWEAEQERLKKEEEERIAAEVYNAMRDEANAMNADYDHAKAEALKKQIESDHEIALLLNEKFDRDLAEAKAEEERRRIAHEQQIAREAEERAQREAEEKIRLEREASDLRERELKEAKEKAERDAIEAKERAERDRIAAEQKVIADKKAAEEKAEREKQEAIAEERRKAAEAEQARLAEEKRIADEKAKREADETHSKVIGTAIVNALLANTSINRAQSIEVLTALKDGLIPHTAINY